MNAEGDADPAGVGSASRLLALAQKLHDEHVAEGQKTRDRLISEGQSRYDQVVGEGTAKKEELLRTGQAKYDDFVSAGKARHDALIAEAEALMAEAQQRRDEVLQELGRERSLLQKQIDGLRAFERNDRARLRSYLQGRLVELEPNDADEAG